MKKDSDILHEPNEPRLQSGRLYSMLDLIGTTVTCDECQRWQRLDAVVDLAANAASKGWSRIGERDLCPICTKALAELIGMIPKEDTDKSN
jgi:hypothetical protein